MNRTCILILAGLWAGAAWAHPVATMVATAATLTALFGLHILARGVGRIFSAFIERIS